MGSFVALYLNYAEEGIFSGGSWLGGLPLTNLQDQDIGTIARSTNLSTSSTQFRIDLGVEREVGGIAIGPTNMSPGSQFRIRSYADAGYTTLLYDGGVKVIGGTVVASLNLEWENPGFWYGVEDVDDQTTAPWIIEVIPTASLANAIARYWKVEILDTSNSDGFVEAGLCYVGRAFRPTLNFDENNSFTRIELTDSVEALGGQKNYWHRGSRRTMRVTWWRLDDTEGWNDIYRMATRLGIHKPMFVVPDPDDSTNMQKRSFLATFRQSPELRLIIADGVTTGFDLEEVL